MINTTFPPLIFYAEDDKLITNRSNLRIVGCKHNFITAAMDLNLASEDKLDSLF